MSDASENPVTRRLTELGFTRLDGEGPNFAHTVTVLPSENPRRPDAGVTGTKETLRLALNVDYPWYFRVDDCTVVLTEHDGTWKYRGTHAPLGPDFHCAAIGGEDC